MNSKEMIDLCKRHTLYAWTATGSVTPLPIERAEGVFLYTPEGHQLLDFNSQAMNVCVGHSHPRVIEAIKSQLDQLVYVFSGMATKPRGQLS